MQAQLQQVDVARKEFVATASHELRTPIFSLGGFVELLRDEDLDEATRREFLDTMAEQVERLQKLAVDLLDLSRLDAGSVELQLEQVDLTRGRAGGHRRVRARPPRTTARSSSSTCRPPGSRRTATGSGWSRSCVSCSTMPSATPRREPP